MTNKRIYERYGLHEGDRVRLKVHGLWNAADTDDDGCKEYRGTIYQMYELFAVIMTDSGLHPTFRWEDFKKWRVS